MARGKKRWAQSNKKEQTSKATTEKKTHTLFAKKNISPTNYEANTHTHSRKYRAAKTAKKKRSQFRLVFSH